MNNCKIQGVPKPVKAKSWVTFKHRIEIWIQIHIWDMARIWESVTGIGIPIKTRIKIISKIRFYKS
jgi:hypothetical protein